MNGVTFWSLVLPAMLAGCVVLYRQIRRDGLTVYMMPDVQKAAA